MICYLEIVAGPRCGLTHVMGRQTLIGRHRQADLILHQPFVSHRHAKLVRDAEGTTTIKDLGSTNGIILDNEPILMARLKHGDEFEIGQSRFRYLEAKDPQAFRRRLVDAWSRIKRSAAVSPAEDSLIVSE